MVLKRLVNATMPQPDRYHSLGSWLRTTASRPSRVRRKLRCVHLTLSFVLSCLMEFMACTLQSLEENVGSVMLKLSPEELQEVRKIAEQADAAQGHRYPEMMVPLLLGDTPPL